MIATNGTTKHLGEVTTWDENQGQPLVAEQKWRVLGKGKIFEVRNSKYLDVSLRSTEEVEVFLESIPEMVVLHISPASEATTTRLELCGFKPPNNTTTTNPSKQIARVATPTSKVPTFLLCFLFASFSCYKQVGHTT